VWAPGDERTFAIDVRYYIGDAADPPERADAFETLVCSPAWLQVHFTSLRSDEPDEEDVGLRYRTGRGVWLMERWDPVALQRDLEALLADAAGPNWAVVANRLSRHLDWEYDYRLDEAMAGSPPDLE
jgi:hypothetical protein